MESIFENAEAFEPMFDDAVKVTAVRTSDGKTVTISAGFRACVLPIENDDPFTDDSAQTERQRYSVMIPIRGADGWNEATIGSRPRIGDTVELKDGSKTSVTKVSPITGDWYELEVRS